MIAPLILTHESVQRLESLRQNLLTNPAFRIILLVCYDGSSADVRSRLLTWPDTGVARFTLIDDADAAGRDNLGALVANPSLSREAPLICALSPQSLEVFAEHAPALYAEVSTELVIEPLPSLSEESPDESEHSASRPIALGALDSVEAIQAAEADLREKQSSWADFAVADAWAKIGLAYLKFDRVEAARKAAEWAEWYAEYSHGGIKPGNLWYLKGQLECLERPTDAAIAAYTAAAFAFHARHENFMLAESIRCLGWVDCRRDQLPSARMLLERAHEDFHQLGEPASERLCLETLGNLALNADESTLADQYFNAALRLQQEKEDLTDVANRFACLGEAASKVGQLVAARSYREQALSLFRQHGNALGEADCLYTMAHEAFDAGEYPQARTHIEAAIELYRRLNEGWELANCIDSLGEIAAARGDSDAARASFLEALACPEWLESAHDVGLTHRSLARIARDEIERNRHLAAATQAWRSIEREDLVEELLREFGHGEEG